MTKKKWFLPLSIVLGTILLLAIAFFVTVGILVSKGYGLSTGRFLIADNGSYMLVVDNSPIVMSDRTENKDLFKNCTNGDKVLVFHNGIAESYPAQSGVYFSIKLKDGYETDIPTEVIDSLTALGWLE